MKLFVFLSGLLFINYSYAGYSIIKGTDGAYTFKGCHNQTIGDTNYLCCDNDCQTKEEWIKRMESAVDTNYMTDLAENEEINRYTMTDEKVDFENLDTKHNETPALGKAQEKLDSIGNKILSIFGF